MEYSEEQIKLIKFNMVAYGGSFVVALAGAMHRADSRNLAKIAATWPEYMEKYLNFGK